MCSLSISSLAEYFDKETKSLKRGENHYKSGHVEAFSYVDGVINGSVRASMKNKVYKVTVFVTSDAISETQCECPRGEYKCSHSAALAIYAMYNMSCTDLECSWKKPKEATEVKAVEDIFPSTDYSALTRTVTEEDRDSFHADLVGYNSFTGMGWILSPEPQTQVAPVQTVDEVKMTRAFQQHEFKEQFLLSQMSITVQQQKNVEISTRGQRSNPLWLSIRKGRLTASNFGSFLNARSITQSLCNKVLKYTDISKVKSIHWGISNEDEGLKMFTAAYNVEVQSSGLWLSMCGTLGASPDGLVGDDAIVEVKCPYTHRNEKVTEVIESKPDFYIRKSSSGQYQLKETHNYFHQVQGQLHITGRRLCYFVVWTTKETVVLEIARDDAWVDNIQKLQFIYKKYLVPKIILQ